MEGEWEAYGEKVMGATMELMNKFLRNQSIIEFLAKFLNKLTMGPCNLKRGGTDYNLISKGGVQK